MNSITIYLKIFSTCNKKKSVVAERFIRTLKNKIFKHMTAISKNVYFDVLDDIIACPLSMIHCDYNSQDSLNWQLVSYDPPNWQIASYDPPN